MRHIGQLSEDNQDTAVKPLQQPRFRFFFFVFIVVPIVFGCLPYLSATNDGRLLFYRQALWIGIGCAVAIVTWIVGCNFFLKWSKLFYAVNIFFLILLRGSDEIRGSSAWFRLPMGITLQPSEFMKVTLALVLAEWFSLHTDTTRIKDWIVPIAVSLPPFALVLMQPDLGTASLFPPVVLIMLFIHGMRWRHLFAVVIVSIALVYFAWNNEGIIKPYQKIRVYSLFNPDDYPDASMQYRRSLTIIGSGGIDGLGFGESASVRLPDNHNDFFFAVVAGEGGLRVSLPLVICYAMLITGGLLISWQAPSPGGREIALCVTSFLGLQVLLNMAVTTAIMPTTGVTLPFASYGGSSMVASFWCLGLLLAASTTTKPEVPQIDTSADYSNQLLLFLRKHQKNKQNK